MELKELCKGSHEVRTKIGVLDSDTKNNVLNDAADFLVKDAEVIIEANQKDYENAKASGMAESLLDRLMLDQKRIEAMADGLRQVAKLPDPVGEVISMNKRPNGLIVSKKRVPIGVIGIIFEARPNVTADAFGLCFKAGNCCILKGGKEAIFSNIAIVKSLKKALEKNNLPSQTLELIEATDRQTTTEFMKMKGLVDLLIPRGGKGLISAVVENATVPVIETGTGNCHIYIDASADLDMACTIIENAKTQRIGVCNACESLVINSAVLKEGLSKIYEVLEPHKVEMRCDERSYKVLEGKTFVKKASEEEFGTEYLDYIISVKTVDSVEEAIEHINRYNTGHSESIITKDYDSAMTFLNEVDAACVYLNASTRFSDGNEFGFGAEVGISTQKLHARGPMGLEALTSYKYVVFGDGQVRE